MNPRTIPLLLTLIVAGCLQSAPKPSVPTATLWSAAAEQVEAGRWDMTHKLVKDLTHVAKTTSTPLPKDYDEFWQPYIDKNQAVDGDVRGKIAAKLREWGK